MFIGISTSRNSGNIISGLQKAKQLYLKTACFLEKDGGMAKNYADIALIVPSNNTSRIQEVHAWIIHVVSEQIEQSFV